MSLAASGPQIHVVSVDACSWGLNHDNADELSKLRYASVSQKRWHVSGMWAASIPR